ncbi:hypothetical protein ACHAWF_018595 [Thalassiosira exigua]
MSRNDSNESDGGCPRHDAGGDSSSESDNDSECYDTLAPLPDDLLVHPDPDEDSLHQIHDAHGHSDSSSASPHARASKRRSVEAGSGRPIFPVRNATKQDLVHARKILEALQEEHGFSIPDRGNLDNPNILWKEGRPDYTIADLHYLLGKTKNHPPGSLEEFVENFVKTWEMEATHKEFYQWTTVDRLEYEVQANGGKTFSLEEAPWVGNYNWLLSTCDKEMYDATNETFESSHGKFRYAFPEGFPWELLEVFSGPPKITFTWRHWAVFSGEFEGHKGSGETITMTGFGVVTLNEDNKAKKIEIYFDPDGFLRVLRGQDACHDGINRGVAFGEPIAGGLETLARMMSALELEEKEGSESKQSPTDAESKQSTSRCPFSSLQKT